MRWWDGGRDRICFSVIIRSRGGAEAIRHMGPIEEKI